MPVGRQTGHRLRSGLWLPTDVDSSYAVSALPVQTDMGLLPLWGINAQESDPPKYARITTNADLSQSGDGFLTFSWVFSFMTFLMLDAWFDSFLPSGIQSAPVTVMTYDETEVARFIQATLLRTVFPSQEARAVPSGWGGVKWTFVLGTEVFDE